MGLPSLRRLARLMSRGCIGVGRWCLRSRSHGPCCARYRRRCDDSRAPLSLVDLVAWSAVVGCVGKERGTMAVTTSTHIDFLAKPKVGYDLVARGEIIKQGRLVVGK